jgi:hypothetical protein
MQVQPRREPAKETKTAEVANELTQEELGKVSAGAVSAFLTFFDRADGESFQKGREPR